MAIYKRVAGNLIIESIGAANSVTFQNTTGVANVIITGDLSVSGNASLTGNISGDKLFNGTTSIEIQTASGNACNSRNLHQGRDTQELLKTEAQRCLGNMIRSINLKNI